MSEIMGTHWEGCEDVHDKCMIAKLKAELAAAKAALDALREDAERYRALRKMHLQTGPGCWIRTGDDLDEAIDAERAK